MGREMAEIRRSAWAPARTSRGRVEDRGSASLRSQRAGLLAVSRRAAAVPVTLLITLVCSATAFAQLDPLLFIKRVPPTVILVVDTSLRMLEDGTGNFYDPNLYLTSADSDVMSAFPNIDPATMKSYGRKYKNLSYSAGKYAAEAITAVPSNSLTTFLQPTRYAIAKDGISSAVSENPGAVLWGLVRLRQVQPTWRVSPNCAQPVPISDATQSQYRDRTPCNVSGGSGNYGIYTPVVSSPSYLNTTASAGTMVAAPGTAASVLAIVNHAVGDNTGPGLVPAGQGEVGHVDRPITYALDDARLAAVAAMTSDASTKRPCRNTVIVLITGGKDDGSSSYVSTHNPATTASSFLSVTGGGVTKRVPILVVGVKPSTADEDQLRAIATNSGGEYVAATTAAHVTAAINRAVQWGFERTSDFDSGRSSEFLPVSPIVGTVDLKDARDAAGATLPNTDITANPGGQKLPQRSNVTITAGFSLPGFDGRLRAFRTYRPVTDSTKPGGWKFVSDGTRLWPDLDGRPELAGMARTPASPDTRNIFTYIPNGSGGGSVVSFTAANASILSPHLGGVTDVVGLISSVRAQGLGAIIGSTPALMDPPSLDPPPDDDYGRKDAVGTFVGDHQNRRSVIFVGANDGMMHAIDARTGYEVWAFIPYNLLPKLRALLDGQPVEQFDYFVDSSPKLAEVKISGQWRSLLIFGQGPGGTFYQAFDVTEAGMGVSPTLDGLTGVDAMLAKFDSPDESIEFKWAYPNYSSFDPGYSATFTVTDGTPGGKLKLYGDLRSTASYAEKTVGFTWSDPAVGPLDPARTKNAVIVGSGYFQDVEGSISNRASGPKAGNALYLIDVDSGKLIGNSSGSTCAAVTSGSGSGSGCVTIGDVAGNGRKNALQADPTAAGDSGSTVVNRAYLGDVDGKYWRFNFTSSGSISAFQMLDTSAPIYASSALLFVGSADVYTFFATGSDILPVTAPGGTGTFRLYGLKDNYPSAATTKFSQSLATVTNSGGIANGERPSTAPSVAGDIVFYTTTVEASTTPCSDFTSNLYAVTYAGGAAYDSNANGKLDKNESPIAATTVGRATAPFIVDQHLYFGTTGATGANVQAFGDPEDFNNGIGQIGVRILSWREMR